MLAAPLLSHPLEADAFKELTNFSLHIPRVSRTDGKGYQTQLLVGGKMSVASSSSDAG